MEADQRLMKCLADAHRWELAHHPILGTLVGRHVYLSIADEISQSDEYATVKSLKQIFSHTSITERAVRFKLRELEQEGYIKMDISVKDGRYRKLIVTEKFISVMKEHQIYLSKVFLNNLIVLINGSGDA